MNKLKDFQLKVSQTLIRIRKKKIFFNKIFLILCLRPSDKLQYSIKYLYYEISNVEYNVFDDYYNMIQLKLVFIGCIETISIC